MRSSGASCQGGAPKQRGTANPVPGIVLAVGAHPDDIEFGMAGTLLLLRGGGWEVHYLNLGNGCCGGQKHGPEELSRIRLGEAKRAAKALGARFHPPFCNDLEIFYELRLLRRVAAVIREIRPNIILTHPPVDYMEDHTNTCRLVVSAAFAHAMPNFRSVPSRPTADYDVTIYHCVPHTLLDPLRRPVEPECFVNVAAVLDGKCAALAEHRSQQAWLETSQGMDSLRARVEANARLIGSVSGRFEFAEGWRRHLHHGFSAADIDPLREALGMDYSSNET